MFLFFEEYSGCGTCNSIDFFFFATFIYTDLIYRVCCWKIQKLNTTETEKKIKKKTKRKKSITKGLNLTITKNGSIF